MGRFSIRFERRGVRGWSRGCALSDLKSFDGSIKLVVEKASCFDVVADIEDDMTEGGWKTRLRKSQLQLRH
jgi:hypothetical protein